MNWILKRTLFRHFWYMRARINVSSNSGGEDLDPEVRATVVRLQKKGLSSILDLSMEADLSPGERGFKASLEKAAHIKNLLEESIGKS